MKPLTPGRSSGRMVRVDPRDVLRVGHTLHVEAGSPVVLHGFASVSGGVFARHVGQLDLHVVGRAPELVDGQRNDLRLLEAGDIDYRKVGKHRRIKAQSLMAYMARDDEERRDAANELTRLNQEMGLL